MYSGSSLTVGMRSEAQYISEGSGRSTSGLYCANKLSYVSNQNSMCIMDRYDLPENPNVLLLNQSMGRMPYYGMVGTSRCIRVFDYVHASTYKIMSASKYNSNMIHEYAPTSI